MTVSEKERCLGGRGTQRVCGQNRGRLRMIRVLVMIEAGGTSLLLCKNLSGRRDDRFALLWYTSNPRKQAAGHEPTRGWCEVLSQAMED